MMGRVLDYIPAYQVQRYWTLFAGESIVNNNKMRRNHGDAWGEINPCRRDGEIKKSRLVDSKDAHNAQCIELRQ